MKLFKTERVVYLKSKSKPKSSKTLKRPTLPTNPITKDNNINSNNLLGKKFNVYKDIKFLVTHEIEPIDEGRWTLKEHIQFLQGLNKYGIKWRKVKTLIPTRTGDQIRSHAQKFYNKFKLYKDDELGIDFTNDNIKNLTDMINHVKNINSNYNIVTLFLYISEKIRAIKKSKKALKKAQKKQDLYEDDYINDDNISNEHVNIFNNNIFNNINVKENNVYNDLNILQSTNNNFNNFPINNIFVTNFNFINNYNDSFINNFLNNLSTTNIPNNMNNDNIFPNNLNNFNKNYMNDNDKEPIQNLNNSYINDDMEKELLNKTFFLKTSLNNSSDNNNSEVK